MNTPTIMVHIADRAWTLEALHCAGMLARGNHAHVALMKMVPVRHIGMLGTEFGYMDYTAQERSDLRDYAATIEDYGVAFSSHVFQYATLAEALVDAADYVDAEIVFATLPPSIIPYWRQFQLGRLVSRLARHQRQFFSLDQLAVASISQYLQLPDFRPHVHP